MQKKQDVSFIDPGGGNFNESLASAGSIRREEILRTATAGEKGALNDVPPFEKGGTGGICLSVKSRTKKMLKCNIILPMRGKTDGKFVR